MLKRFIQWLDSRTLYVLVDPRDNSVTMSKGLYRRIRAQISDRAEVFVFRIPTSGHYAFMVNPPIDQPTVMSTIQYNTRHRCVGFESLCPTVNRIAYDYGLPPESISKLSVKQQTSPSGHSYFLIPKPTLHAESSRS